MPSANFALLERAIEGRLRVVAEAKGGRREMCPHALGYDEAGEERVLVFQFAGYSSSGLSAGGDWRCFDVADLLGAELVEGAWLSGSGRHSRRQSCVTVVHVEVAKDGLVIFA